MMHSKIREPDWRVTFNYRGYKMVFDRQPQQNHRKAHWLGKIVGIKDLIMAEADDHLAIEAEARAAIDDYIDTCYELGTAPNRPRPHRRAWAQEGGNYRRRWELLGTHIRPDANRLKWDFRRDHSAAVLEWPCRERLYNLATNGII